MAYFNIQVCFTIIKYLFKWEVKNSVMYKGSKSIRQKVAQDVALMVVFTGTEMH